MTAIAWLIIFVIEALSCSLLAWFMVARGDYLMAAALVVANFVCAWYIGEAVDEIRRAQ